MIKRVDENGNVRLITNIRKPRKWRRYEYLLSDGNAYIDTKVLYDSTKSSYKIECKFSLPSNVGSYDAIFGAYTDETHNTLRIIRGNNNSIMYSYYNIKAGGGGPIVINTPNTNIKEIILTASLLSITENNTTTIYPQLGTTATDTTSVFYLFCQGTSSGAISCKSKSRIYYFKLYDNNTLIRDFVPAQYNGQYGLWDLVEDKFYGNAGTGTFTVGPEIKNYDEIYEVRRTTSLLPSGVELYNSLKFSSSSNTYIETDLTPTSTTEYKLSFKPYSTTWAIFGGSVSGNTNTGVRLFYRDHLYAGFGGYRSDNITTITANTTHIITYKKTQLTIDSTNYSVGLGTSFPTTLSIGRDLAWDNGIHGLNGEVHYLQIYDNNILIRNFLPCTYLGEPGMWDTVENKFYRNQGTGQFTLGNKITLKEYEYLLTVSANQSIDTGILLTDNHSVAYDVIFKYENNGVRRLMGPSGASSSYFGANSNGKYDRYSSISIGNIDHLYEEFNLITKKLVAYINNFKYRENSISVDKSIGHCYIFSLNGINNYTGAGQYFYSGKMVYDGKVIRDFVPCSYNGTPGLWDKVEWKFYANAGSGNFTLGPEKASGTYPVSYLYDSTIYEEPDGSKWLRIVHHDNPNTRRFTNSDSFTTYIHTNEHLFFDVSWCNTFTLWELMVKLKTTSEATELKFRWILNYNPMTATFDNTKKANVTHNTSSGYTVPSGNWGGLMKINSVNTYLCDNNGTNGNWWGAIGCKVLYSGGLPGWNSLMVTTGYLDLYIRIA